MKRKIIIILPFVFVLVGIIFISVFGINKRKLEFSTDLSTYSKQQTNVYMSADYSDALVVFPNEISGNAQVNNYFVLEVKQMFKRIGYHIALDITYSESEYDAEIARLQGWQRTYNYQNTQGMVGLLYDTENFQYPAFVASYNLMLAYEYALILDDYRIVYVYINWIEKGESRLDDAYLPNNYFEKNDSIMGWTYNVYRDKSMWEYDQTE